MLSNLDENGNIALVICDVMNFECYQFKGKCIKYYDGHAEDQKIVEQWMQEWNQTLQQLSIQDGITFIWPADPVIVIEFEITDIFDQTPKVGAGERIKSEKNDN